MSTIKKSIKFGIYEIRLDTQALQLKYIMNGEVVRVKDVSHEFTQEDFFKQGFKLAKQKNYSWCDMIIT